MYLGQRVTIGAVLEDAYADNKAVAATDLFLASDANIVPVADKIDRPLQKASISTMKHLISREAWELTFTMEIKGDGTKYDALFKAAGFSPSADIYSPISTGWSSLSVYVYAGGKLYKLKGGVVRQMEFVMEAGEIAKINFTVDGLYVRPTDVGIVTGTNYGTEVPPIVSNTACTIGSFATGVIQACNIVVANTVKKRLDVNSAFGVYGFQITGRNVTGTINPEAVLEATQSFWLNWETGIQEAFSIGLGSVDGNKWLISAPKLTKDNISPSDEDGIRTYTIPFTCHMSSGDDELTIDVHPPES